MKDKKLFNSVIFYACHSNILIAKNERENILENL